MSERHSRRRSPARAEPGRTTDTGFRGDISKMIVSASADGIVAVDERGIIRVCNPAAGELFARSAKELVGTPFGFPIPTGRATDIDLILPGGGTRVVEMRVATTTLDRESLLVVVLRDVTRHRQLERDLEAALERQNIVVGVAAHELQNPLFAIAVLLDVLRDRRGVLTKEQRVEIIDSIAERTDRLQTLMRKLLTASRIDAEAVHTALERVPVLEFILEVLGEFGEKSQDVRVSCTPDLVAFVDRGEFAEMLNNYLDNAFAYGRSPIEVRASGQADWVEVRVCDAGSGVPEAFVSRLFVRFSREPHVAEEAEGTGLGLWIVRSLANANDGDAWYEPNPDGGSCFCLRLPRADSSDTGTAAP
jgi:signal transduction histidine kinase